MAPTDLANGIAIRPFDPHSARPSEYRALNAFNNRIRREGWPAEDLTTVAELVREKRSLARYEHQHYWLAWQGSRLVGLSVLKFDEGAANRHAAEFTIEVEPALRGHGIGSRLLQCVVDAAATEGKTLLLNWSSSLVPSADAFMHRLGAQEAQVMAINELRVEDFDHDCAAQWLARSEALSERFVLGTWDGAYPAADLDAIVAMHTLMNTMPHDKLALDDEEWSAEQLREQEASLQQQGITRYTAYVRDLQDGSIAGFTETLWNPARPAVLAQGDTAVSPHCRGLGIATWLKAAMLQRMLELHPTVGYVRTWNGTTNAPMLRINEQLGFRERHRSTQWQVPRAQIERYLMSRGRQA